MKNINLKIRITTFKHF